MGKVHAYYEAGSGKVAGGRAGARSRETEPREGCRQSSIFERFESPWSDCTWIFVIFDEASLPSALFST